MGNPFQKCRLCLKLGDFCSIFEQDDTIKLSEMVMSFTNIKIYEEDGFSDRVCTSCIENLSTAYLFKQQCERIDTLIRNAPDTDINLTASNDYKDFFNQEFHMHTIYESNEGENSHSTYKSAEGENTYSTYESAQGDNDLNSTKDMGSLMITAQETSDETDSDIDSVKCACCSQPYTSGGTHTCKVACTIEHNELQRTSSSETLVASDAAITMSEVFSTPPTKPAQANVSCVLCDNKYDQYADYVIHLNKCTNNVKLHHYVCPVCHEMFTEKNLYLGHAKTTHFKDKGYFHDESHYKDAEPGIDCVDIAPVSEKTRRPKAVRRQIGWSIEDIYQEIDCKDKKTPTSSPLKNFFSKMGNETLSRQSTPKKVSFRKFIENAKNSNYIPFQKYIQNYKMKKQTNAYSPIKGKLQVSTQLKASISEATSDSDYHSPSGTSEEKWKLKQNLICACDKKIFMLSEYVRDKDRLASMIFELGGVVAESTKMEMLATHFISVLPNDTLTGMMVCALATGKWVLSVNFIYDSFRCKKFLQEHLYEWMKHPKIIELDTTSVEVARAAVYWHMELQALNAKFPFEGKQIVLIMKKKYRQYYHMIFKSLKAKPVAYDPRTPGSCCTADYCFVDMNVIERVKLRFFARHNVPVFPYQYILVFLLKRGNIQDEQKYLLQDCKAYSQDNNYLLNNTY